MNATFQTTSPAPRGRPRKGSFVLPDNRLTNQHTLIDVRDESGRISFVFHSDEGGEVVVNFKPFKSDFAPLMDAVKAEALQVGSLSFAVRGAVKQAFHSAVVGSHFRSLK